MEEGFLQTYSRPIRKQSDVIQYITNWDTEDEIERICTYLRSLHWLFDSLLKSQYYSILTRQLWACLIDASWLLALASGQLSQARANPTMPSWQDFITIIHMQARRLWCGCDTGAWGPGQCQAPMANFILNFSVGRVSAWCPGHLADPDSVALTDLLKLSPILKKSSRRAQTISTWKLTRKMKIGGASVHLDRSDLKNPSQPSRLQLVVEN